MEYEPFEYEIEKAYEYFEKEKKRKTEGYEDIQGIDGWVWPWEACAVVTHTQNPGKNRKGCFWVRPEQVFGISGILVRCRSKME